MFSQKQIRGQILDSENQRPVAGVELFENQSQNAAISDENGKFSLIINTNGPYELILFKIDYNTLYIEEIENAEEHIFVMEALSVDLSAVEIVARRTEFFALKQLKDVEGTAIYAGKKTEVVLPELLLGNFAVNNARQVYAQVAGLNIYEGNDGGLQLGIGGRGLDPNRTSNFNTRQNQYDISADVLGYPESYYTPPTEAVSEIQIIRGASSLQYGTQFGGRINFKLRKIPSFKKLEIVSNQTIGSFGLFNTFNSIGFNHRKFSVNGFFNYKQGDGYRPNSEFDSANFFISIESKLSDRTSLEAEFTYFNYLAKQAGGLTDEIFRAAPRTSTRERNWFDIDWKLYNLRLDHTFSDKATLSISLFGLDATRNSLGFRGNPIDLNSNPVTSIDEQNRDGEFINPRDLISGSFKNYGAEIRLLNQYLIKNRKATLLLGAKYYKADNSSRQGPGSTGTDADFSFKNVEFPDYANQSEFEFPNLNVSAFGENIFYVSDRVSVTPGFRIEHIRTQSQGNYNQVNFDNAGNPISNNFLEESKDLSRSFVLFGIGLNYKMSKSSKLYANVSQNYRSVTFSDIRVVNPTFIVDPEISDEKGLTFDVGVMGRKDKHLSYELSLYSILYDDRIGIILDDRANRVRKNIGTAIITGTESLIDLNIASLISSEPKYFKWNAFINSAFTFSEYLDSEENNVKGKRVEFIPTINLKAGISGGYKNLLMSFQWSYLSQQFTDVQNSLIPDDGDIRSGVIGEIPSYSIMDVSVSYKLKNVEIKTGLNNILDEAYFTRRATGYPGPGIIPSDGRAYYFTISYRY